MTAMATTRSDSSGENAVGPNCTRSPAMSPPAKPASAPETANATSFIRMGDTVNAAALCSLSRTAISDRPTPLRRMRLTKMAHRHSTARHT